MVIWSAGDDGGSATVVLPTDMLQEGAPEWWKSTLRHLVPEQHCADQHLEDDSAG